MRGAASLGRWADSGVAEHWLLGWIGERRSAREWTLGAETEFRDHGVWHPSALSSSPSICSFTNVAPNQSHSILNNGDGACPGCLLSRISTALVG